MKSFLLLVVLSLVSVTFSKCSEEQDSQDLAGQEAEQLFVTQAEINSLQWMREEEMLAHDVYAALSELYSVPVFRNITKSELWHTNMVADLLIQFGIDDPAANHERGVFKHSEIQSLYDQLLKQGSSSYEEAIKVGLQIEDLDIADLEKALAEEIENEEIIFVYKKLLMGSGHHMNAFWFHATKNSIDWEPEHISPAKFTEIVESESQ